MLNKALVLFAAVALLAGCSGDEGGSSSADVEMADGQVFEPEGFTAAAGETIVFENTSSESHTVTAYEDGLPDGADYFASGGATSEQQARSSIADGLIEPGESFELTLEEPGTYRYFCIPHEGAGMIGTITVPDS